MMYSQKSYNQKLGTCSDTIAKSGCFLCSFCNLLKVIGIADIDPPTFNKKAFPNGGCLANASYWASLYNMTYQKTYEDPNVICICETNYFKSKGYPQHFFLYNPRTKQKVDPLDTKPDWKPNGYPIISYRVFTPIKTVETKKELKNDPTTTKEPETVQIPIKVVEPVKSQNLAPQTITKEDLINNQTKDAVGSLIYLIKLILKSIWNKLKNF